MPKGSPKPQTVASTKYQKKAGIVVKGFKVKKDLADEFTDACRRAGVGQAATISSFMEDFVEKNK